MPSAGRPGRSRRDQARSSAGSAPATEISPPARRRSGGVACSCGHRFGRPLDEAAVGEGRTGADEANTWDSLGFIHDRLGRHRRAVYCYHRGLALYVQIGDRYDEAETLTRLGDSRFSLDDCAGAVRTWQRPCASSTTSAIPTRRGSSDRLIRAARRQPGERWADRTLDLSVAKTEGELGDAN